MVSSVYYVCTLIMSHRFSKYPSKLIRKNLYKHPKNIINRTESLPELLPVNTNQSMCKSSMQNMIQRGFCKN